jgi:hypothetical protein
MKQGWMINSTQQSLWFKMMIAQYRTVLPLPRGICRYHLSFKAKETGHMYYKTADLPKTERPYSV